MNEIKVAIKPAPAEEFKKLFIKNPIHMEILRFRRRFINVTGSPRLNQTLVGLVTLFYFIILGLLAVARQDIPVFAIMFCQMVALPLTAILASHSAIAGERDRRSWDLLQVAPVTQAQIVVGKFMSAMALCGFIALLSLPVSLMSLIFYGDTMNARFNTFGHFLAAQIFCLAITAFVSAFTLYLSARLKNANTALVSSIGSVVVAYVFLPALFIGLWERASMNFLLALHPAYVLAALFWKVPAESFVVPTSIEILGYSLATALFLQLTTRHLVKRRRSE